ncbi:MAG: dihydrolipoyl dehydrogenase [Bdellovibrionota bacterium]
MSELYQVKVPDLGDFKDIEVVEVLVKVGDEVKKDQSIIVIESEKATMDVPSPESGVVEKLYVQVGSKVQKGFPILSLRLSEGRAAPPSPVAAEAPSAPVAVSPSAPLPKAPPPAGISVSRRVRLAVLGGGPGGYEAAIRTGQLGIETLLVERSGPGTGIGGVCLHSGCIPSKALIDTAHHLHHVRELEERGVSVLGEIRVDLKKLQQWKRGIIDKLRSYIEQAVQGAGAKIQKGEGRLLSPNHLEITDGGKKEVVEFENLIVATGSRAIELPGLSFDGKTVLDARAALDLEEVPRWLVVVGGGYIGLELGIAFKKLGAKVTVVELQNQLLPGGDEALARPLARRLQQLGVEVHLGAKVEKFVSGMAHVSKAGSTFEIPASHLLVAVGRRPNTEKIGLDAAGVQVDPKGFIPASEKKQTNVSHIYAIGDVTHGPALAHKASAEGVVAAEVIGGLPAAFDNKAIPAVVFTDPELSYVGMNDAEAKNAGFSPKSITVPNRGLGRAMAAGESEGFARLTYDENSGALLGAALAGGPATDMIGGLGALVEMGANIEDLSLTIFPHPTFSEQAMIAAQRVAHKKK